MNLSIRWKLILAIVLPLLLITGVVMGITLSRIYTFAASNVQQRNLRELSLYASRIGAQFEALAEVAHSTATLAGLRDDLEEAEIYELLGDNVRRHDMIYGSALAFEPYAFRPDMMLFSPYVYGSGTELKALDIGLDSYDYRDGSWEWYSAVAREGQAQWTDAYFDQGAGNVLMTTYAAPVRRGGRFVGVATVDVMLDRLQAEATRELEGHNFAIVGRSGKYLAHYDPESVMSDSIQEQAVQIDDPGWWAIIAELLAGQTGFGELEDFGIGGETTPGQSWVFYTPIEETGWYLLSVIPEAVSTAELRSYLVTGTAGLVLTVILAFVFVWIVSSRMTRPIRELAAAVSNVARGKLDTPIRNIRSLDELGRLSIGFNQMLKNLNKYIEREGRAAAAREVVERELEVARDTQRSLLPRVFPPFPERREFDLHALNQPARHVGGDFFDFFLVDSRRLMFTVADVSGKGVSAALVMAVTRTIIRNLGRSGKSPAEILEETNALLIESQKRSAFVTVFLGCYDTGSGTIVYANAGHTPPYRIDISGEVSKCGQATGTIVGMLQNTRYYEGEIRLRLGDTLVLFTDGIPEARTPGGEFYGQERLRALLEALAKAGPRELCEQVVESVSEFQQGNLADDLTILALKRTPRASLHVNDLVRKQEG